MPNLEMQDCDPDYNVTLTPDMFSGKYDLLFVEFIHFMEKAELHN